MPEIKKESGFMHVMRVGLKAIAQVISASVFPKIAEGAELVMKTIDDRMLLIEKRILRKISSMLVIGTGGLFLIFALFFSLKEYLGWSNAPAYFSIGIVIFVTGLLLKLGEPAR